MLWSDFMDNNVDLVNIRISLRKFLATHQPKQLGCIPEEHYKVRNI